MKRFFALATVLLVSAAVSGSAQNSPSDEAGRVLGLENAWNHAIEAKDTRALDMILADSFIAVDIDGSLTGKTEFLAGIKSPDYQPSQAIYEQIPAHMYGDVSVTTRIFRVKEIEKGKTVIRRERFTDTWIKKGQSWHCVVSHVTLIR
jgi:ketosteroid isomerase-like protein